MPLGTGSRVGAYEVLGPLGKGGMGEVWEARDARLGRLVALKVLPAELLADRERLARFESEARLASSLNHPNIVTIHDIGQDSGETYLVMERVSGETLRGLLASGPLPLKRLLAIAAQVADGLARAHASGIVHRDLKPENVMVAADGRVKILDFGLAKLVAPESAASRSLTAPMLTQQGAIVGTVAYMSPEQASGAPVDFRSDQFSLGTLLYEMASGQRPFAGPTAAETLTAILRSEPAPLAARAPEVPAPLRWIVERCLAKEPAGRYASTEDLARDLAALRERLPELAAPASIASARDGGRPPIAAGLFAVAAGLALLAIPAWRYARRGAAEPGQTLRVTQLTPGGREYGGAISPDGRTFAYRSEEGDTPDLYIRQVSGGEPLRLTHDAAVESDLVYALDGESLYYVTDADSAPAIWRIGVLGGTPRKIVDGARYPSPSADGKRLAWVRVAPANEVIDRFVIEVASPDGAGVEVLHSADGVNRIALSPDGRRIAFSDGTLFAPRPLRLLDVATRKVRAVTDAAEGSVYGVAWLPDGKRLAVSLGVDRFPMATGLDLAIVNADGSSPHRILPNVNSRFVLPTVSADGKRLLASLERYQMELWKAPLGGSPEENGRAARVVVAADWAPFWSQVSQDGRTVLFNSKAKGSWNLFTAPVDGSAPPRQITFFTGNLVTHAALSPDGSRVAYASQEAGPSEIWIAGVDGSGVRKLSPGGGPDYWPVFSRDGRTVYYSSRVQAASFRLWRVPASGGKAEPVPGGDPALRGDASPVDDRFVAWANSALRVFDGAGKELLSLPRKPVWAWTLPVFSPDGRTFTFLQQDRYANRSIWLADAATGEARPVVLFPGRFEPLFRAGFADGGTSVVVNRVDTTSNVVLVEGF